MKNYFKIFNLPTCFEIDLAELEKNYLYLQQQYHPDQNISNLESIENSILINQAYNILVDDLKRSIHLLQIVGIDIENDDNHIKPDISILQYILDLQEQVSQIKDLQEIIIFKKNLKNDVDLIIKEFCQLYANKNFDTATQILIKAKYLTKTIQDLKLKEKTLN